MKNTRIKLTIAMATSGSAQQRVQFGDPGLLAALAVRGSIPGEVYQHLGACTEPYVETLLERLDEFRLLVEDASGSTTGQRRRSR